MGSPVHTSGRGALLLFASLCCGAALGCSPCSTVAAGLCPTPHSVPHTSFCAPHLILCPTPRPVPHTSSCAPHLILCPTPRPVPHASFRARAAPGAAGEHGAAPGRQREDLLPADGGGDSGSSRWVSAFRGGSGGAGPPRARRRLSAVARGRRSRRGQDEESRLRAPLPARGSADTGLECPVCKEDYAVAEQVRQLPCNHFFHGGCIVPWLELVRSALRGPRGRGPAPPAQPPPPPAARHVPGVQEEPERRGFLAALARPRAGRRLRRRQPEPGAVDVLTLRPLPPGGSGGVAPSDPRAARPAAPGASRLGERRLRSGTRNVRAPRAAPNPVTGRAELRGPGGSRGRVPWAKGRSGSGRGAAGRGGAVPRLPSPLRSCSAAPSAPRVSLCSLGPSVSEGPSVSGSVCLRVHSRPRVRRRSLGPSASPGPSVALGLSAPPRLSPFLAQLGAHPRPPVSPRLPLRPPAEHRSPQALRIPDPQTAQSRGRAARCSALCPFISALPSHPGPKEAPFVRPRRVPAPTVCDDVQ